MNEIVTVAAPSPVMEVTPKSGVHFGEAVAAALAGLHKFSPVRDKLALGLRVAAERAGRPVHPSQFGSLLRRH